MVIDLLLSVCTMIILRLYVALRMFLISSYEVASTNSYECKGILLNTNTIDAFKNADKKEIVESLSKKVRVVSG